jgi:hypothetical protein
MSRPHAPAELTHREFWRDFVAADWPAQARELVSIEATPLCKLMGELRQDRDVVCGRRAGAGGVILMEARGTYERPYVVRDTPDATVADPGELTRLLNDSI